jgi:hypothetical protein
MPQIFDLAVYASAQFPPSVWWKLKWLELTFFFALNAFRAFPVFELFERERL